jgi:hypothetical protein
MKFKLALSLPKLMRVKVALALGFDEGAKIDVKLRLRGRQAWKWTAMADPGRARALAGKKNGKPEAPPAPLPPPGGPQPH